MNRITCGICGFGKNTFLVDSSGYFKIRICISCAKVEGFEVDLSRSKKCNCCGQRFIPKGAWQMNCPVCYVKSLPQSKREFKPYNKGVLYARN